MAEKVGALSAFALHREKLARSMALIAQVHETLQDPETASDLMRQRTLLLEDGFRIIVYGEMKRGKSSFINAMLGEHLLPSAVGPCTAISCHIRFGDVKHAILHRHPPHEPERVDLTRDPGALRSKVTIKYPQGIEAAVGPEDEAIAALRREHPYVRADIFAPCELLHSGVELLDSPGTNEAVQRTEEAQAAEKKAAAVVIMFACDQQVSETEVNDVKRILVTRSLADLFFVVNKFDTVRDSEEEVEQLRRRLDTCLLPIVGKSAKLFFVSAKEGLEGRVRSDPSQVVRSGVPAFEFALGEYVVKEGAAGKLRLHLRAAEAALNQGLLQAILERERVLREPYRRAQASLDTAIPNLRDAERHRDAIIRALDRHRSLIGQEVGSKFRKFGDDLVAGIPGALASVEISTWESIAKRNDAKKRLAERVASWAGTRAAAWEAEVLTPLLVTQMSALEEEIREHVGELDRQLRAAQGAVGSVLYRGEIGTESEVSTTSRLLGLGIGLIGGAGTMIEGATLGVGAAASGLLVNIVAGTVMGIVLGLSWPVTLIGLVVVGTVRSWMGAESTAARLRRNTASELAKSITSRMSEMQDKLVGVISEKLGNEKMRIQEILNVPVKTVTNQIESLKREREARAGEMEAHLKVVAAQRQILNQQMEVLAEVRRFVEPESDPRQLAARVAQELELKMAQAGRGVPVDGRVHDVTLDAEARGRLVTLRDVFIKDGLWDAIRESRLSDWWLWLPAESGSLRDRAVWRTVCCLAILRNEPSPPSTADFRRLWLDAGYQSEFLRVVKLMSDEMKEEVERQGQRSGGAGNPKLKEFITSWGDSMYKAYSRAEKFARTREHAPFRNHRTLNSELESEPKKAIS